MGPCGCAEGQDRAEPNTIDAEAACVSTLHTRAVRLLKFFSISANIAILAERSIVSLLNTGNSGGDHTYGITEGLDVVVKICGSTREW